MHEYAKMRDVGRLALMAGLVLLGPAEAAADGPAERFPTATPSDLPDDPNFAGIGRTVTDSRGRFHFLTVKPGSYPAAIGSARSRPAHVHLAIRSGTARLVTQLYFAADPHVAADPMFALLGDAGARHVAREFRPAIAAAERGFAFEVVTDGPRATFFE